MAATNYNAEDSLLGDDEKKRRFFWSILWLIFSIGVALPLCSMLAPIWLMLQLVEAFLPVLRDVNIFFGKAIDMASHAGSSYIRKQRYVSQSTLEGLGQHRHQHHVMQTEPEYARKA
mmetsp:Transcript_7577/g.14366  ORF Transcript_7577/g.14366 Transcript_7577/m.14366 type:complete len:117 (+) Transcript_7577:180-530(+)